MPIVFKPAKIRLYKIPHCLYSLFAFLDHLIWGSSSNIALLERMISGLGSLAAHGPPLLAWTLSTYLARGEQGLGKAARLGKMGEGNLAGSKARYENFGWISA